MFFLVSLHFYFGNFFHSSKAALLIIFVQRDNSKYTEVFMIVKGMCHYVLYTVLIKLVIDFSENRFRSKKYNCSILTKTVIN